MGQKLEFDVTELALQITHLVNKHGPYHHHHPTPPANNPPPPPVHDWTCRLGGSPEILVKAEQTKSFGELMGLLEEALKKQAGG